MSREIIIQPGGGFLPLPGGQAELWNDVAAKFIFAEGGWGSGKTYVGAHKLLDVHMFNAFDRAGNLTGVPSAAIAPTYKALGDFTVPALLDAADSFGLAPIRRRSITIGNQTLEDVLLLPEFSTRRRPSYILLRTAERPELIAGWEAGAGWFDEPTRWKEDWTDPLNDPLLQAFGRIRHPRARAKIRICTYTNEGDATRVYQMARSGIAGGRLFRLSTRDNPAMREYVSDLESVLTADQAAQYIEGRAMRMRGVATYSAFNSEKHVVDVVELVPGVPICVAFDFNIEPGMHVLIGQFSPFADEFAVADEIHDRRLDLGASLEIFAERYGETVLASRAPLRVYGDPAGSAAWSGTGQTHYQIIREFFGRAGIPYQIEVATSHPPVVDRVNCVNQALEDGRGVHVRIARKCVRLIGDLTKQRWDKSGKLTTENGQIGHASDAFGYWVVEDRPIRAKPAESDDQRIAYVG